MDQFDSDIYLSGFDYDSTIVMSVLFAYKPDHPTNWIESYINITTF